MDKIMSFGDSFTWGSDMEGTYRNDLGEFTPGNGLKYKNTYSRKTWHALLAKYLGREYECFANEGCSNQTIVRTFFENIHRIEPNDVVNVNFTWRDRYDFYNEEKNVWSTIRPGDEESSEHFKLYYKHLHNSTWDNVESLKAINIIINYLEIHNIKYIVTCIDDLIYKDPYHNSELITVLRDQYKDKIIWFNGKGLLEWSRDNNYSVSEWWHPLEDAHEAAYNYIKEIKQW